MQVKENYCFYKKIKGALSQAMCCCKYLHDYVEEHKLSKHQVFNNDETGL